jgi:hypothetical protein
MDVCRATKANGVPCPLPANGSQGLCWATCTRERRVAEIITVNFRDLFP